LKLKRSLFALLTALVVLVAACADENDASTSKVFEAVPWDSAERLRYDLLNQGGDLDGRCVLETSPEFEPGRTKLTQLCDDGGPNRDDRTAIVDANTLEPITATRVITGSEDNRRTTFTSMYNFPERVVQLIANVNGEINEVTRELPQPDKDNPDPGIYDDESLFWIVRGIRLRNGYEGAYNNVNAGNGRIFVVEVSVAGSDTVTVPAGTYETWRVRIRTQSIVQTFWIDQEKPHRVVRARIERITYELTAIETPE
jgi:hypothetical protein